MRTRLSKYRNQRTTFIAAVGRRGSIQRKGVPRSETVCLEYVTTDQQLVADHLWIPLAADGSMQHLHHGDVIRFRARVLPYSKGYARNGNPTRLDYRLAGLSNIEVIDSISATQIDPFMSRRLHS